MKADSQLATTGAVESDRPLLQHSASCPNCGSSQVERFCAHCGQEQTDENTSISAWLKHVGEEVFSLDGRLPRTIKLLLRRPGFLTVEWEQGRRAAFVRPLRLYLFSALAYFALAALSGDGSIFGAMLTGALEGAEVDPQFRESVVTNAPRYISQLVFLMVPVGALLLKLFDRRRHYALHLVFSFHFHAAFFLIGIVILLSTATLPATIEIWMGVAVMVWILAYAFVALRVVYRRSRLRSAAWLFFISFCYLSTIIGVGILLGAAITRFGS